MIPLVKIELRQTLLAKRHLIENRVSKDALIADQAFEVLKPFQHIGIYLSRPDEIDTLKLIKRLLKAKKAVYSSRFDQQHLTFYPLNSLAELELGPLHIYWPPKTVAIKKEQLEVMIVPLIAFDQQNHRLGYGKGYYDKYLADFKGLKVGLGYAALKQDVLPAEGHDIALDLIITEESPLI